LYRHIKRILDIVFSLIALLILWPFFIVIAIAIKIDSPGPIFFKQKRVGENKEFFSILKFRTMKINTPAETPTHLLKEPRKFITRTGAFLRKSSLDELPQILNILKGEMSIVGPRPALWNQYDLIDERDKYGLNDITPGLTGWAQINGRDELSVDDKVRFDAEYLRRMSLFFDIKCIFMTIIPVLRNDGVKEGKTNSQITESTQDRKIHSKRTRK